MTTPESCGSCRFFHLEDGDSTVGECRRRAPRPVVVDGDEGPFSAAFPSLWLDQWCGEYQPATKDVGRDT